MRNRQMTLKYICRPTCKTKLMNLTWARQRSSPCFDCLGLGVSITVSSDPELASASAREPELTESVTHNLKKNHSCPSIQYKLYLYSAIYTSKVVSKRFQNTHTLVHIYTPALEAAAQHLLSGVHVRRCIHTQADTHTQTHAHTHFLSLSFPHSHTS